MPKYFDADELLKKLPDDLPYKASVKRVLIQAPEADVVPRAEFEQLQHKYDLAVAERDANVKGFTEELARSKAEAKSEIVNLFWEIESELRKKLPLKTFPIPIDDRCLGNSYELAREHVLYEVLSFIAELEKKYIPAEAEKSKAAKKEFFTPEEVRKMSAPEVRANYAKIISSMSKWH